MPAFTTAHINTRKTSALIARFTLIFVLMVLALPAASGEAKVALITASGSNIDAISARDIRRLYLGLKSTDNESVRNPVLNLQSDELYDEFLKNIMRMTEGSYKRKLVKAIFRQGREEIVEISSLKELNDHLLENKGDVSFVEITAIENMKNIEVVQILW